MTQNERLSSDPVSSFLVRLATEADRPRLIPLINSAFAIETFLEGTRTDEECLAGMMQKGTILAAENAALKNNTPPRQWTLANIAAMKRQMERLGLGYDWAT